MKLEVGIYVRTEEGKIFKTDGDLIYLSNDKTILYRLITRVPHDSVSYKVVKASFNIIDLIKVGDILEINGEKYEVIYDESYEKLGILIPSRKELSIRHSALEYVFKKYEVAIVTKEQFEQISYKIGDDK